MQNPQQRKKVAVVGSGISAISTAWFLSQHHDVVLFEKQNRLGGHTNTIKVEEAERDVYVDTGFIVFNRPNYPNLTAMFEHLQVNTQHTDMSFAVSIDQGRLEYSGTNLDGLFAQRRNLLSYQHWSMIFEIMRFNKQAKADLNSQQLLNIPLQKYLDEHGFSSKMTDHYLLPMAAAIWSCPVSTMLQFPTRSFLQFFENHGLLNIEDRPQWETVIGGSIKYLEAIVEQANFEVRLGSEVFDIEKQGDGLLLHTEHGQTEQFDHVVFGCHADEAYRIVKRQFSHEFSVLANFDYQENIAYLHTDESLMPVRRKAWSSWNYLRDTQVEESRVAVSYWMNLLQNLQSQKDYFVTLNPLSHPKPSSVIRKIIYQHPVFDQKAMLAQKRLHQIQGKHNIWFCGSYFGYGFHEDGLSSAVNLVKRWGIALPWEEAEEQSSRATGADESWKEAV